MKLKTLIFIGFVAMVMAPSVVMARCGPECIIWRQWDLFLGLIIQPGTPIPPLPPSVVWPFAGTIIATFPCPCNAGIAVITLPVFGSEGPYFIPLAGLKAYGMALPGNIIMGGALPGGFCGSPLLCLPLPVKFSVPPIPGAGTSLVPPLVPPLPPVI